MAEASFTCCARTTSATCVVSAPKTQNASTATATRTTSTNSAVCSMRNDSLTAETLSFAQPVADAAHRQQVLGLGWVALDLFADVVHVDVHRALVADESTVPPVSYTHLTLP